MLKSSRAAVPSDAISGERRCSADASGPRPAWLEARPQDRIHECTCPIATHHLNARMLPQPGCYRVGAPVRQQIDDAALLEIAENRSIPVALLPGHLSMPTTRGSQLIVGCTRCAAPAAASVHWPKAEPAGKACSGAAAECECHLSKCIAERLLRRA